MLAQLGDLPGARGELEDEAAEGGRSQETAAALAALYCGEGRVEQAARAWGAACSAFEDGCAKYRDREWLAKARHWPAVMVDGLTEFLTQQGEAPLQA